MREAGRGGERFGLGGARTGWALMARVVGGSAIFLVVGLLALGPVIFVLIGSFDVSLPGDPFTFGLAGWTEALGNVRTLTSIGYSLLLSLRVPIGVIVAFPIAWLLVRGQLPCGAFIERALWFGFFLPTIPLAMGWVLLLDENYGLLNVAAQSLPFVNHPPFSIYSLGGIIWVHLSATTIPLMVILLKPAVQQIDSSLEEAALMCGANTWTYIRKITLPLLTPAILTAFIASLIRGLEVYEVEQMLGTPKGIYVYSTRIVDLISLQPPSMAQALALSTLFLVLLLACAALYQLYLNRVGSRPTLSGKGLRMQQANRPWVGRIAAAIVIVYIAFSILLPLALLIIGSFKDLFGHFETSWTAVNWETVFTDPTFAKAGLLSLGLGLAVSAGGCLFYALVAWALVRTTLPGRSALSMLVWLPWAIPGIVLGVSLLTIVLKVPPLRVLYGTMIPIGLALVVKEMPYGIQIIATALRQVAIELEEAATMAGAGFVRTFTRVTIPLVAPTLVSVFLLVFTAVLRDISTITLLASPGTRTMSLLMFEHATTGKFESAAVIGVVLALISFGVTVLVFRINDAIAVRT